MKPVHSSSDSLHAYASKPIHWQKARCGFLYGTCQAVLHTSVEVQPLRQLEYGLVHLFATASDGRCPGPCLAPLSNRDSLGSISSLSDMVCTWGAVFLIFLPFFGPLDPFFGFFGDLGGIVDRQVVCNNIVL